MANQIFDKTLIPLISKSLDVAALRQRTTATNIANVTTVGYRRVEVKFEEKLRNVLQQWHVKGKKTHGTHRTVGKRDVASITAEVVRPDDNMLHSGFNNVNIDREMSELSQNQLLYQLNIRLLKKGFSGLRSSIHGRTMG
jgi:flagellar basal-body rod protein FlgB